MELKPDWQPTNLAMKTENKIQKNKTMSTDNIPMPVKKRARTEDRTRISSTLEIG